MDAIQTSDPTGIGPGTPGQASAFRRALDRQALHREEREGPLDLTAPLNFAEIRAALSRPGSGVRPPVAEAAQAPAVGGARSGSVHGVRRRAGGRSGSKRVGRIGVFVALATALSVGTAAALVFSSGGQGTSVSLPTTNGNLPVATMRSGPGAVPPDATSSPAQSSTPSASARATPSLTPSPSSSPSASAGTPSASTTSQPSNSPSASASQDPGTASSAAFTTLQPGSTGTAVVQVQQMLAELDLLYRMRHQTVFVDAQDYRLADPKGTYGQATADAITLFQQRSGVGSQPGVCDQATYDALAAEVSSQAGSWGRSTGVADAASAVIVVL